MRTIMRFRTSLALVALFATGAFVNAQPTKLPTADEVKAVQAKFQGERDKIVKDGIAKRFIPILMEKADELAKKSETALAAGRLAQASEAIRQARWQLPYQPVGVPDHVSRIIGNLRLRHSDTIKALAFSPDGLKLATASSDKTVKIWDLGNGHELLTYTGHTDKLRAIAWSSDGKFIASAGDEQTIKIWNPTTGKDEHSILGVGKTTSSLALSKDGKHLFTAQLEPGNPPVNGLFVYDTKTGKLVREVRDFTQKIDAICVSHDGTMVAVGDDAGNVRLFQYPSFVDNINQPAYWAQQDPQRLATYHLSFSADDKTLVRTDPYTVKLYNTPLPGAPFQVAAPRLTINAEKNKCALLSKDGKTLFVGDEAGNIKLYDPDNDGQKIGEYKNAHTGAINALVFNPDGSQLGSCSGDFTIRLWDFNVVLQSRDFEGHDASVWTASFSPDGAKIVSASADRTVKVWDRDTAKVLFTITDHTAPVTVAKFSPEGNLIASAGGDKIVRIFDANGKPLRTCEGHTGTITFLDFSSDSKKIVSGSADRRIKVWDADTGKQLLSIDDNPSIVASVAFHPNGKQVAVGNIDQTIRLYDALTGKMQHGWNAHGTAVNGVAYSPNGEWLASCGADMSVQIWPLATPGANSIRLVGHTGPVSMVAFRMDNIHVVSCGADQLIKLWKIEGNAGKEVQTFRGHKDWVTSVAFSKDGFHIVSSSVDKRLKIWEITSRELPLLAEHSSAVETVAVSPDGKIIATGSVDRTIKLWDRKTGVEIATLTGHERAVMSLVFSPDSKRIISSGSEAALRFWDVSPPRPMPRSEKQLNVFGTGKLRRYSPYIATDPAGKTLFVWLPINDDRTSTIVDAFDIDTGTPLFDTPDGKPTFMETKENGGRKVDCLAFCANGKLAATGAKDGSIRFWDMKAKSANISAGGDWFFFDKAGVADLALTPDGAILVAASDKGEIKIAKVQGRETIKSFQGHKTGIGACILSPDGKRFATIGADNVVKAWSIEGKELRSWDLGRNQGMFVVNLAFSPDAKQLVTANSNTTVYVLELP